MKGAGYTTNNCFSLPAEYSRSAPVIWSLVPFFSSFKKIIWYEIQMLDELVVGSFEPPDARAACDGICRHFAYESYLLKVWLVKTHSCLPKQTRSVKRNVPPS